MHSQGNGRGGSAKIQGKKVILIFLIEVKILKCKDGQTGQNRITKFNVELSAFR